MTRFAILFFLLFVSKAGAAAELDLSRLSDEWRPVAGVSIASEHVGAERDFEEFNPGVSLGARTGLPWRGGEWGVEAGVFRNSYNERSYLSNLLQILMYF